jgi:hypothetical protein
MKPISLLLVRVAVWIVVVNPVLLKAQISTSQPLTGSVLVTTGGSGGTFDVGAFLGADTYRQHSTPITGQNTVTTNVEGGHIWNGHEALGHVTTFTQSADTFGAGAVAPLYDRHATWAGMLIGGRQTPLAPDLRQQGIAPGTDLRSGALSTGWSGNAYALSFGMSWNSFLTAYDSAFATSDVINSSFGFGDPSGSSAPTAILDAMSVASPRTTFVVSAGNSGPATNTVGGPASGYNNIAVAALTGSTYDTVASFSSRGPQDFGYYNSVGQVLVTGVRAAVDLAAPGTDLTSAFYGGQSGGNNATLVGSLDEGSDADAYTSSINGTSFSAPLVAGGAALLTSAAKTLPSLSSDPDAAHSLVVKSILLTTADKTQGWDNGLAWNEEAGFHQSTQSLDWNVGAGRMNLERSFGVQVLGQTNVNLAAGGSALVQNSGWDFGQANLFSSTVDYVLSGELSAGSSLTASLTWQRMVDWGIVDTSLNVQDIAQADMNLSLWKLDELNQFSQKIAESGSLYNTVEHLYLSVEETGRYGLRVAYVGNTFDNTVGAVWGSADLPQEFALSWDTLTIIPEPAMWILLSVFCGAWMVFGKRERCR